MSCRNLFFSLAPFSLYLKCMYMIFTRYTTRPYRLLKMKKNGIQNTRGGGRIFSIASRRLPKDALVILRLGANPRKEEREQPYFFFFISYPSSDRLLLYGWEDPGDQIRNQPGLHSFFPFDISSAFNRRVSQLSPVDAKDRVPQRRLSSPFGSQFPGRTTTFLDFISF
jgi:hypothetical protein